MIRSVRLSRCLTAAVCSSASSSVSPCFSSFSRLSPLNFPTHRKFHSPNPVRRQEQSLAEQASAAAAADSSPLPSAESILSDLSSNIVQLSCLHHAILLSEHLKAKSLHETSESPASSSSPSPSDYYQFLLESTEFEDLKQFSWHGEVSAEKIEKTFTVHTEGGEKIRFHAKWRYETTKIRQMGIYSMEAEVFLDFLSEGGEILSQEKLFSVNECEFPYYSRELYEKLRLKLISPGYSLSNQQFSWILSVFCTFPSDFAFDIFSAAFLGQKV